MSPKAAPAPARVLDPRKVDAWRMARQLLGAAPGTAAGSPEAVARALVGVQAQVTSSAALAIALRSKPSRGSTPATEATATALRDRRLTRSWAMRGTLHLFAADDVPTVAAALKGEERWRRPAWLRWFGLRESEMERLIETVTDLLADGRPRTRAELAEEIGDRLGPKQGKLLLGSWGSVLKIASDHEYLVQSAEDDAGTRFVRASRWLGAWRDEAPAEAMQKLVERYFAAYGPASSRELLRWWGVSTVAAMRPIIASLGDRLTEVQVDGVRALVRTEDLDAIDTTVPGNAEVRFVGGFDPLIVGGGLRERLLPPAHLKRISRTAGWISPVVLVDGRAAAVWDSKRRGDHLAVTVDPFASFGTNLRRAVAAAAERVGTAQGAEVSIEYGPAYAASDIITKSS